MDTEREIAYMQADVDLSKERQIAVEVLLDELLPLLIRDSAARPEIVTKLRAWADKDTDEQGEVHLGNTAEGILKALGEFT